MKKNDWYFSLLMFSGFLAYFFLMKALGLYTNINLRFLNFFIHFGVVYLAMRTFRNQTKSEPFYFWRVATAGVRASVPAVVGFALFQYIYLKFLDPGFMTLIQNSTLMGSFMTPMSASWGLLAEGMLATFFSSYVGMRIIAAQDHARFPTM